MRRADRLFQIIQILRGSRRPVTAAALARELEVSTRTVYRDIADLIGQRVPVEGEAGLGYVLEAGFDMPPLMLTPDEIDAVVLGAQLVARLPDPILASSARDVIAKILCVVPEHLRPFVEQPSVSAKPTKAPPTSSTATRPLRSAIHDGRKIRLRYRSEAGEETLRTVWPVVLGYADTHLLLIAWCELRSDFRHFRIDRVLDAEVLSETYAVHRRELRRRWEQWRQAELRRADAG